MEGSSDMGILKNWYDGNICPAEDIAPKSKKYHSIVTKIGKEKEYFATKLSSDDRERFEKWDSLRYEYEEMTDYANFSYGFKLGAMLAFEIFAEQENE